MLLFFNSFEKAATTFMARLSIHLFRSILFFFALPMNTNPFSLKRFFFFCKGILSPSCVISQSRYVSLDKKTFSKPFFVHAVFTMLFVLFARYLAGIKIVFKSKIKMVKKNWMELGTILCRLSTRIHLRQFPKETFKNYFH